MSVVTAQMVKELRDATLAGMSDCKKALDAAHGDMEKALVILREKGLASAAKKSDRATTEGVVAAVVKNHARGFLFEVNCETDFVTKNDAFQSFVHKIEYSVLNTEPQSLDDLLKIKIDADKSVQEASLGLAATVGENIQIKRFATVGNGLNFVASYVHAGGRIGVLVELAGDGIQEYMNHADLLETAHNVALQAAAMKPLYLSEQSVPTSVIKSEEEIIRNKFLQQGKPEAALAKIVPSSLKTWFKEVCLVDQLFVKDDAKTIAHYVLENGRKLGIPNLHVISFIRLELGQGAKDA